MGMVKDISMFQLEENDKRMNIGFAVLFIVVIFFTGTVLWYFGTNTKQMLVGAEAIKPSLTLNCDTTEPLQTDLESKLRENKFDDGVKLREATHQDRAAFKACEVAKSISPQTITRSKYEFHIQDIVRGDKGVEIYTRVFENGSQIGFGADGTIDIERFRINNPPVLVRDPNGTIKRYMVTENERNGKLSPTTIYYREDPKEALIQSLERTLNSLPNKHDDTNIVEGKIGRTITTEYSYTGDGFIGDSNSNWSTLHGATTAGTLSYTQTTVTRLAGSYFSGSTYKIWRGLLAFDTSAIGGDTISSAVITMYSAESTNSAGGRELTLVEGTQASVSEIVGADYDNIGSTEFVDTRVVYDGGNNNFADETYTLNSAGISHINGSGDTKFAIITDLDFDNTQPTDGATETNTLTAWADYTGTTEDPVLVVEHAGGGGGEEKATTPRSAIFGNTAITGNGAIQ